jgi:hypothetical protein
MLPLDMDCKGLSFISFFFRFSAKRRDSACSAFRFAFRCDFSFFKVFSLSDLINALAGSPLSLFSELLLESFSEPESESEESSVVGSRSF